MIHHNKYFWSEIFRKSLARKSALSTCPCFPVMCYSVCFLRKLLAKLHPNYMALQFLTSISWNHTQFTGVFSLTAAAKYTLNIILTLREITVFEVYSHRIGIGKWNSKYILIELELDGYHRLPSLTLTQRVQKYKVKWQLCTALYPVVSCPI